VEKITSVLSIVLFGIIVGALYVLKICLAVVEAITGKDGGV